MNTVSYCPARRVSAATTVKGPDVKKALTGEPGGKLAGSNVPARSFPLLLVIPETFSVRPLRVMVPEGDI